MHQLTYREPIPSLYTIECAETEGITRAAIAPKWGANIVAFTYGHRDLLWPISLLEPVDVATLSASPTSYGVPLLAPTPGRVGKNQSGRFNYQNCEYRIDPSRHGLVRNLPWAVRQQTSDSIECAVEVIESRKADYFPFQFLVIHKVSVGPRILRSRVVIRNTGDRIMPANLGWHPYLHRPEKCVVKIPARSYWELEYGSEAIPTGKIIPADGSFDFIKGRELATDEHWDHIFTDLIYSRGEMVCSVSEQKRLRTKAGKYCDAKIEREVVVAEPNDGGVDRRISEVMLYTPPGRDAVAIEPFSCPPDAINLLARGCDRANVIQLEPGESATFEMALRMTVIY